MRIAIIADIHANLPALEAVHDDIATQHIDEVLVGGDLVGRGPQGSAVVQFISNSGWQCVRGNHEEYLLSFYHGEIPDEWHGKEEWAASEWMARELTHTASKFIAELPFSCTSELIPQLRLFHGSPRSNCEGIGHWTSDDDLENFFSLMQEKILLCAHTHRPMERRFDGGLVVNVGSVGLPFNGDWRAQYVILQRHAGRWVVEFRQVPYDRDHFLKIYESSGFLSEGGITAQLLKLEVLHARSYLVPFLTWCTAHQVEAISDYLDDFLTIYDPRKPLAAFIESLPR